MFGRPRILPPCARVGECRDSRFASSFSVISSPCWRAVKRREPGNVLAGFDGASCRTSGVSSLAVGSEPANVLAGFAWRSTSYLETVCRRTPTLEHRARAVGVFLSAPGDEAQVDFFRGAPTLDGPTGQWKRPWVFRMTLCHCRHGYDEAVWDQRLETFLRRPGVGRDRFPVPVGVRGRASVSVTFGSPARCPG
jgi:hypothetical protein